MNALEARKLRTPRGHREAPPTIPAYPPPTDRHPTYGRRKAAANDLAPSHYLVLYYTPPSALLANRPLPRALSPLRHSSTNEPPLRLRFSPTALVLLALSAGLLTACADDEDAPPAPPLPPEDVTCTGLFGVPVEQTGLDEDACGPACVCSDGVRRALEWDADRIQTLLDRTLLDPPLALATNPYAEAERWVEDPTAACAVHLEADGVSYRLETWPGRADALLAGGMVTHDGACGACSSLQDLAVYVTIPNLTAPVRECGMEMIRRGEEAGRQCIADLGFTDACTSVWTWNTLHTRQRCASECLTRLNAPFNEPDGSLNPCLQCDEDLSGPVFKATSGRTRRNSGLPTAICRPCGPDIAFLEHDYRSGPGASFHRSRFGEP